MILKVNLQRFVIVLCALFIFSLACVLPSQMSVERAFIAPRLSSAPLPPVPTASTWQMVVCYVDPEEGGLRVRVGAGQSSRQIGWLYDGDTVTVSNPTIATDLGVWYYVENESVAGWVNGRWLCAIRKGSRR